MELVRLIEQAIQLAGEFEEAFTQVTIHEKMLLTRGFVKKVELDPASGQGHIRIIMLPVTKPILMNSKMKI